MPPILPCGMQTAEEVRKGAIHLTAGFLEFLKSDKPLTSKSLAIQTTAYQLLTNRLREIEEKKLDD